MAEDAHVPAPGLRPDEDAHRHTEGHTIADADRAAEDADRYAHRDAYLYSDPDALADAYEHADLDTDNYPDPDAYRDS